MLDEKKLMKMNHAKLISLLLSLSVFSLLPSLTLTAFSPLAIDFTSRYPRNLSHYCCNVFFSGCSFCFYISTSDEI